MKNQLKYRFVLLALVSVCFVLIGFQNIYGQDNKKNRVRLNADYFKVMDGEKYLDLKATARVDKQNIEVSNIDLIIYNDYNDKSIKLGQVTTNMYGKGKFVLKDLTPDSSNTYNLRVSFKGNDAFKKASKEVSFKNIDIWAKLVKKDSINYITATLIDKSTDSVIVDESLSIQVQRLFRPMRIGEEFNYTDENGTIIVPIEEGIPGVDGVLNLEVVLKDHDEFGTVKAIIKAPVGIPFVEESTYNNRTLWSPRNKTPIFILVFTNVLILGIWGIFIYLISNLFKIYKSKS